MTPPSPRPFLWLAPLAALVATGCGEGASLPTGTGAALVVAPAPAAQAALSPESRAAVAASPVPVLLPPEPFASAAIVTSGSRWAAVSASDGDVTVSLHTTDMEHIALDQEELAALPVPPDAVRGVPAWIGMNEGIRYVHWTEGRAAYALEVECYDAFTDPRCTEPAFVLGLAEDLVNVGGGS